MQCKISKKIVILCALSLTVASCTSSKFDKNGMLRAGYSNGDKVDEGGAIPLPNSPDDAVPLPLKKKILARFYQRGSMKKMTLSYVAEKILATNPDIEIFNAREEQTKYGIDIKKAAYWPTIDVKVSGGIENIYKVDEAITGTKRTEGSITIKGTVFDFGKRGKDVAQAEAAHEAAKLRAKDTANKIVYDLTNAYLNVLENRDLAKVTNKDILQIHKFKNLVKANLDEGNASIADLKKVEARLENARTAFVDFKTKYETSREDFRKIADFYPVNLQSPPKILSYKRSKFSTNDSLLLDNKLELRAVRKDIEGLTKKLSSIKASRLPTFNLAGIADYKKNVGGVNDPVKDYRVDFSMKYRVFDGGAKAAEQKKVEALIREGKALLRKKSKNLEQDMRNADSDQKASSKKNALLAKRLKAAQRVVGLNTEQFREGVLTVFELLDAQAQLLSAQQDLIVNKYKKYRVRFRQLRLADQLLLSLVAK